MSKKLKDFMEEQMKLGAVILNVKPSQFANLKVEDYPIFSSFGLKELVLPNINPNTYALVQVDGTGFSDGYSSVGGTSRDIQAIFGKDRSNREIKAKGPNGSAFLEDLRDGSYIYSESNPSEFYTWKLIPMDKYNKIVDSPKNRLMIEYLDRVIKSEDKTGFEGNPIYVNVFLDKNEHKALYELLKEEFPKRIIEDTRITKSGMKQPIISIPKEVYDLIPNLLGGDFRSFYTARNKYPELLE